MDKVGIIAEYDPFHLGHLHQISEIRNTLPDARIIVVLGGNFAQRGTPMLFDKYDRAKTAVLCGADLVLELPVPYCCASAPDFARAGISLLAGCGCDFFSFGSECGDSDLLDTIAARITDDAFCEALAALKTKNHNTGIPVLRQKLYEKRFGGAFPTEPNDILGLEYLCAVRRLGYSVKPLAIKRTGGYNQTAISPDTLPSASAIRSALNENRTNDAYASVPDACRAMLACASRADFSRGEAAILFSLTQTDPEAAQNCHDIPNGMGQRILASAAEGVTLSELYRKAATKQYTTARIRRMVLSIFFRFPRALPVLPPYTVLLAANDSGIGLLRGIKENAPFPVLSHPVDGKKLTDDGAASVFQAGQRADGFYQLLCRESSADAMRHSPYIHTTEIHLSSEA